MCAVEETCLLYCCCLCYRQDSVEAKKKQAECLKKLGEIGLESGELTALTVYISYVLNLPSGEVAKYCDEYVCLSVHEDISRITRTIFTK